MVSDRKKIVEFKALRERVVNEWQQHYNKPDYIEAGEYTYGFPIIQKWNESEGEFKIGKFCSIGQGVIIILGGEPQNDWATTYPFNSFMPEYNYIKAEPSTNPNVTIGNDCRLGHGVKVMSGVTIGDGCIVYPNSVVSSDLEPYSIYDGIPAKFVKYRFDEATIKRLLEIAWWNWKDEEICNAVPLLQSNDLEGLFEYYANIK